ncbi:MAG: hypothetical protein DME17_14430 [Candidatus Rokuibacteriota bacterium]|nr:MAG: hypothetical protein DME17_14430 [Candidatus Rokubacteria bacterium]
MERSEEAIKFLEAKIAETEEELARLQQTLTLATPRTRNHFVERRIFRSRKTPLRGRSAREGSCFSGRPHLERRILRSRKTPPRGRFAGEGSSFSGRL